MADEHINGDVPSEPLAVMITPDQSPVPVIITAAEGTGTGVPLTADEVLQSPVLVTSGQGTVAAPTETEAQQNVMRGQRRMSAIWEYTQAVIALLITIAIVYTAVNGIDNEQLANAFFLIIGFYFSRTNHTTNGSGMAHTT